MTLLRRSKKSPAFASLKQKTVRLKIEGELRLVHTLLHRCKKPSTFASLKQKNYSTENRKKDLPETLGATYFTGDLDGDFVTKTLCY
jgi:hypothetical protein